MTDELLSYYNRELAYIRRLGAEFATAHPKIAARLRLGQDSIDDPHVERLIQAFAYLNARIRHKLDDDFPELTDALLGVLYPHYQRPIPSMAIVRFEAQPELTTGYTIKAGSPLETDPIDGEPCRFRTAYPVTVWPIEVKSASLTGRVAGTPGSQGVRGIEATLRLVLSCTSDELSFAKLAQKSLRFFLKGQGSYVYALYELLFNNTLQVVTTSAREGEEPRVLGPTCLHPVGFDLDEGLLPYPARSFLGYRLLSEFFAFPEKFLFFDLTGLEADAWTEASTRLEVFIYLSRSSVELEQNVSAETFALGCSPMVNLYHQRAEPIELSHTRTEYRVVADARRPQSHEVYAIDRVIGSDSDGREREHVPFYGLRHGHEPSEAHTYWYATRRPAGHGERATEVHLAVVDLDLRPSAAIDGFLSVDTTCLNRDLPSRLPFGGGEPRLQLGEGTAPLAAITCLTAPTPTLRPPMGDGALWRLISHLSLNHLSITDLEEGTQALREILLLYDFTESAQTRAMIEGIQEVRSQPVNGRAPTPGPISFCRGTQIDIRFDESRFAGSGVFLTASVLERFLALYCSVNSFTRLIARVKGREDVLRKWPPRAGSQQLL